MSKQVRRHEVQAAARAAGVEVVLLTAAPRYLGRGARWQGGQGNSRQSSRHDRVAKYGSEG